MLRRAVLIGLSVAALASAAGCDVQVSGIPIAAPIPRTRPTTTTAPAPSPGAAANGTDLDACQPGSCEVFVSGNAVIPLDPEFGFTSFTITFQPPDTTLFYGVDPTNGNLHGWIGGTGDLDADNIHMTVESVSAAGEILKFSPRAN
jgi:hypothetical protein